jgi:hypothetical protein
MAQLSGSIPHARAWNITLRTSHIAVAAVLLGGHVFAMPVARLRPWLYLTVVTGSALLILEAWPGWRWCCQGRGVMVIGKLVLTSLLAWLSGFPPVGRCDAWVSGFSHAAPISLCAAL